MSFYVKNFAVKRRSLLIFAVIMCCLSFFSCVSTKKAVAEDKSIASIEQNGAGLKPIGEGTILSLPGKNELAEKKLDSTLAALIEKGSPASLKEAVLFIQNDSKGLTNENKLYLKIIADIMYLAYPLETNGVKPPVYT